MPAWSIGDVWTYNADVYLDSPNGSFDGTITDLTVSVAGITLVTQNATTYDAYALNLTGNITGQISYQSMSGPMDGIITGDLYMRRADLSLISYNITSTGVIHQVIDLDYVAHVNGSQHPPAEEYDFPLQVGDSWTVSSTTNTSGSIWVQGLVDETFAGQQQETMPHMCNGTETVTVPAGTLPTLYVRGGTNGSKQSWYSPDAENTARYIVNGTSPNGTTRIHANLTGYSHVSPPVTVTQHLVPSTAQAGDTVTITGGVYNTSTGIPVSNETVTVTIPRADMTWTTTTNASGNYTVACDVPVVTDDTPTGHDIASVGVIASAGTGNTMFTVSTLTITGVRHIFSFSPGWNLVTVPVENDYSASSLGQAITGCEIVAYWNASAGMFESYVVGVTPGDGFAIEDGVGYFVYVNTSDTFSVTGAPLSTVAVDLFTGWNTIGWFDAAATSASSLAPSVPYCSIAAYWNATSSTFESYTVGVTPPPGFAITRGMGVFVYVTAPGTWTP